MRRVATKRLDSLPKRKAAFIEPMDCARVSHLPDGLNWVFEIKLDGYRAVALKSEGGVNLFSQWPSRFAAIQKTPLVHVFSAPINNFLDGIHDKFRIVPHNQVGALVSSDVLCSGHLLNEAFMQVERNIVRRIGNVTSRPPG